MKAIFSGHFELGEKIQSFTQCSTDMMNPNTQIVMLVSNIGFLDKLFAYHFNGLNCLIDQYMTRYECANSFCIRNQLQNNRDDVTSIIDLDFYNEILKFLSSQGKLLTKNTSKVEVIELRQLIDTYCLKEFIPREYLKESSDLQRNTTIYFERNLRNIVSQRLKSTRKNNWKGTLHFSQILTENKIPSCRGILFAFFEKLRLSGFCSIDFYIEKRHFVAINKGWLLFDSKQDELYGPLNRLNIGEMKFI